MNYFDEASSQYVFQLYYPYLKVTNTNVSFLCLTKLSIAHTLKQIAVSKRNIRIRSISFIDHAHVCMQLYILFFQVNHLHRMCNIKRPSLALKISAVSFFERRG